MLLSSKFVFDNVFLVGIFHLFRAISLLISFLYLSILHEGVRVVLPFEEETQDGRVPLGGGVPERNPAVVVEAPGHGARVEEELDHG